MSEVDRAELRRLLAESARPGEVFQVAYGHHFDYAVHDRAGWTVAECAGENWVRLIAAAVNALPGLLDALDAIHELADQIADHYGDNWDHTPACMGEPACPLCHILHIASGGTPDEDEIAAGLAQAWEEGFYAGVAADMGDWEHPPEIIPNPYRPEPNDEHTPENVRPSPAT